MIGLTRGTVYDDKFEILELLGKGGMGTVYKARLLHEDKLIALKFLHHLQVNDEENVKRFRREGKALAKLHHKNIVTFDHFGFAADGTPYTAMELLSGTNLRKILNQEDHLDAKRTIKIMSQVCEGLAHAHEQGICHRDLKPDNIIILDTPEIDTAKIIDFGFVKFTQKFGVDTETLTKTGFLIGSLHYMSPEQAYGLQIDARSDIYSCGCILYEILTGEKPFDADNPVGLLYKQSNETPKMFADTEFGKEIDPRLEAVCRKCMEKSLERRYQSMAELLTDFKVLESADGKVSAPEVIRPIEPEAKTGISAQQKSSSSLKNSPAPLLIVTATILIVLLSGGIFFTSQRKNDHAQLAHIAVETQNLVSGPAKMWTTQPEAQKGPREEGWLLLQNNPHTGTWSVYISPTGMLCVNTKMGTALVTSVPNWDVCMYNCRTKVYFFTPLSEWKGASLKASGKTPNRAASAHKSVLVEKTPQFLSQGNILGYSAAQYLTDNLASTGLKKVEFWVTKDILPPPAVRQVLSKVYGVGLTTVEGLPIKVSYLDETGKKTPVFTTVKITKIKIPLAYYRLPMDFKRVDSEIAVLMDKEGQKTMKAIMKEDATTKKDQELDDLVSSKTKK